MFDLIEKFINDHQVFCGGCLAFITSMIRVWRKSNSLVDKVLDSFLCSIMTVGIFYGIQAVHAIPENVAIAIGSAVGYLGTEKIKEIILAHFQKGVSNENQWKRSKTH